MNRRIRVVAVPPPERWLPLTLAAPLAAASAALGSESLEFAPLRNWTASELAQAAGDHPGSVYLFSDYLWSTHRNLALSSRVRGADPAAIIVHGGASVPRQIEDAMRFCQDEPSIDLLVQGEGERTLIDVLESVAATGRASAAFEVAGTFALHEGEALCGPPRKQDSELGSLASPYLDGWFDPIVTASHGATLESDRGCPFGCTFCDWGAATLSRVRERPVELVAAELEWLAAHHVERLEISNANFGSTDRDLEVAAAVVAARRRRGGGLGEIGINFPKNDASRVIEILRMFTAAGIRPHSKVALQTTARAPLRAARRRNLPLGELRAVNDAAVSLGLSIGTDIMIGLPGATPPDVAHDLGFCMSEDITASTTPVVVLPNAPMNDPAFRSEHQLVTNERGWIVGCTSFTQDDFELMRRLARIYSWIERRQLARVITRFLHDECGVAYEHLLMTLATKELPESCRFLATMNGEGFPHTVGSWSAFYSDMLGLLEVHPTAEWREVCRAQLALVPSGRSRLGNVKVRFDVGRWWVERSRAAVQLGSLPPGAFEVSDPRGISGLGGRQLVDLVMAEAIERPPVLHSVFSSRSPTPRRTLLFDSSEVM